MRMVSDTILRQYGSECAVIVSPVGEVIDVVPCKKVFNCREGDLLVRVRMAMKITQAQLAALMQMSVRSITRYECGEWLLPAHRLRFVQDLAERNGVAY